ncbi:MAG TPA: hypothetical protein VHF47_05890 [Acidimicrobiales bacterium]|nr:hypothetical protein [Acidimicrobiales bacterium]
MEERHQVKTPTTTQPAPMTQRVERRPARRPVLPTAAATAIGSLPHDDPKAAVGLVLEGLPDLPAAPQLPCRNPAEGMLAQAVDGVRGVSATPDGALEVDVELLDPEAPVDVAFAGEPWVGLRTFLDAVAARRGPVKLQLTGPLTLGVALTHAGADPEVAFEVAGAAVQARARALVALAAARAPHAGLVVLLDEPGLTAWSSYDIPLKGDHLVDLLSGSLASLGAGVVTGVHCCGAADWKLVDAAGPDMISLPATPDVVDSAPTLSSFLDRGGLVAWGVVPTDRPIGAAPDPLWRRLSELWADLAAAGCDPIRLRQQALLTPACGLANHTPQQAAHILDLTLGVAERVHSQAVAIRMSVGA